MFFFGFCWSACPLRAGTLNVDRIMMLNWMPTCKRNPPEHPVRKREPRWLPPLKVWEIETGPRNSFGRYPLNSSGVAK